MKKITADMTIAQVIEKNPQGVEILSSYGTNCKKCPNIVKKTLADAAKKHDINLQELLEKLNN